MNRLMATVVLAFSVAAMAWASGCAPMEGEEGAPAEGEETAQSTAPVLLSDGGVCPYASCRISYSSLPGCSYKGSCVYCGYVCR